MKINAVLPCAGRGERAGLGFNKTLALLGEKPVAFVSAEQFAALPEVTRIVVVCGKGEEEDFRRALSPLAEKTVFVTGGETRTASVAAGIAACEEDCEIIAVHDGARPYLSPALLRRTLDVCEKKRLRPARTARHGQLARSSRRIFPRRGQVGILRRADATGV